MELMLKIAEKCAKCGEMFDLGYDLKVEDGGLIRGKEEHLCWKCRAVWLKKRRFSKDLDIELEF